MKCSAEMLTQDSEEGKSRWSEEFIGRGEGCGVDGLNNFRALLERILISGLLHRLEKTVFFGDPPSHLPTADGLVQDLTLTPPPVWGLHSKMRCISGGG